MIFLKRLFIPLLLMFCIASTASANNSKDFILGYANFNEVVSLIRDKYDEDADFTILVKEAWDTLEQELPESNEAYTDTFIPRGSEQDVTHFYLNKIEGSISLAARSRPDDATPTVRQLWNKVTNGLVMSLTELYEDQYSQFLPPKEHEELQRSLSGEPDEERVFYGVGISIDWDTKTDAGLLVLSPLPDSPAWEADVRAGDIIIGVDGKSLETLEGPFSDKLLKAIDLIKGEKDTEVTITIRRSGLAEPIDKTLKRAPINPDRLISQEMLDDEVGYIRLYSFYAHAARDVQEAMRYLKLQGMNKLIFDLRNNPGGFLDQAVEVADIFLPKGELITFTKGRTVEGREFYDRTNGDDGFTEIPMVILLNGHSASASEVVTGALKDNHRCTVIGTTSFGKGSVQEVFTLRGKAGLRLTVSRYFTPSGVCIHSMGIDPDLEVNHYTEEELEEILPDEYLDVTRLERMTMVDRQLKTAYDYLHGDMTLADLSVAPEDRPFEPGSDYQE